MDDIQNVSKQNKMALIKPIISYLQHMSVESLYNYIRFYAFKDVSDNDKKDLLMKIIDVNARDSNVFPKIAEALETDDFNKLTMIANDKNNKVKSEKLSGSIIEKLQKRMDIILDCYFSESNACSAQDLLTYLIFYPDPSDESLLKFVKLYTTTKPEGRKLLIPNNSGHYFTI